MKIILTVHQFFPDWQAGTEILVLETAKQLLSRGHEVEVWTADPTPHPDGIQYDCYEYDGVSVHRYYQNHIAETIDSDATHAEYENKRFTELFAKYLQCQRPDIVHAFHLYRLTCSTLDVANQAGAATVYTPTDFWAICPVIQLIKSNNELCLGPTHNSLNCVEHLGMMKIPSFIKPLPAKMLQAIIWLMARFSSKRKDLFCRAASLLKRIQCHRKSLACVDAILAPTHFMKQIFAHNNISLERVSYQSYGVNTGHIATQKNKTKSERLCVGFIGTLANHKGAHILLEAVKALSSDILIDVKIYGSKHNYWPDYVRHLEAITGDDPRIAFCGTFPNDKLGEILSDIDVLVVPSIWYENTPLIIYYAQAAGIPIIASDLGGMSEVVSNGVNGLLFPVGDHNCLAQAILQVAQDRKFLENLALNAVSPKSIEQYVDELEMIYEHILRVKVRS